MRLTKERLHEHRVTIGTGYGSVLMVQDFADLLDTIAALESELSEAKAQREASIAAERKDCERALAALAGKYPTPLEGYGTNSSWAIADLCRAVAELSKREAEAHAQTAAMLEKAVDIRIDNEDGTTSRPAQIFRDRIRSLIPTSYAAALKAKLEEARLEEAKCIPVQLWARSVDELKSLNMYRTMRIETLEKEIAAHRAARQAPEEKEPCE